MQSSVDTINYGSDRQIDEQDQFDAQVRCSISVQSETLSSDLCIIERVIGKPTDRWEKACHRGGVDREEAGRLNRWTMLGYHENIFSVWTFI